MIPGAIEQAIQAIANSFQTLKQENGFRYDVRSVYRHLIHFETLDSLDSPSIFVFRPEGATGELTPLDERGYRERLRLNVLGWLRSDIENPETFELATKAEAFLSDIKILAMRDPTFGSALIANSAIVEDTNSASWDSEGAVVGIGLDVLVFFDGTNP